MKEALKFAAKTGLTWASRPVGAWRLRRAIAANSRPLKVEIGGRGFRPGWISTDISWNTRYYLDATAAWPFAPGTVKYVFADNVVEHLRLDQCRAALRNARTAIAPDGTIRLATPDVERIARLYLDGDAADVERVMGWHRRAGRLAEHPPDLLRIVFTSWGHEFGYLYDLCSLTAELEKAGFGNVRRCATWQSDDPDLRGLEARVDEEKDLQLVVEADII